MIARVFASLFAGFAAIGDNSDPASPIVWASPNVTIMIGQEGSDDVTGDSDLAAIRASLAAWSAPSCSNLRLIDGGLDANPDDGDDGTNRIFFRESGWPSGLSGAAAVTIHWENSGDPDTWRDADILLNGEQLEWSTTGEPQRYDIQSVVTHELGHLIGLDHTSEVQATMYYVSPRGNTQRRTLHESDINALCFLYPASGARSCMDDGDCPLMITPNGGRLRLTCSNGQCVPGAVGYGGDCAADGDCTNGMCIEDPNTGACTVSCANDPCPNGDLCRQGLCYRGRDDCVIDDDCGENNVVCAIDLDGRRRCTRLCLMDSHCPTGICHGGTGANPPGFCRVPGAGGDGAPCDDGYDCSSLACAGGGAALTCIGGTSPIIPDAGVVVLDADNIEGMDATIEVDAGVDAGVDQEDPTPLEGSGCGCSSASRGSNAWLVLLVLGVRRARLVAFARRSKSP